MAFKLNDSFVAEKPTMNLKNYSYINRLKPWILGILNCYKVIFMAVVFVMS